MSIISLDTCNCKITFHEDEDLQTVLDIITPCNEHSGMDEELAFTIAIAENNAKNNIRMIMLNMLPDEYLNISEEQTVEKTDDLGNVVVTVISPRKVEFKHPPQFVFDEERNLSVNLIFGDSVLRSEIRTSIEEAIDNDELTVPNLKSLGGKTHKERVSEIMLDAIIT